MHRNALPLALGVLALLLSACGPASTPGQQAESSVARFDAGVDPALLAEIEAIVTDPDHYTRACRMSERLQGLDADAIPSVRRALRRAFITEMGAGEFELLVLWWAGRDARTAALWSIGHARAAERLHSIRHSMRAWARSDPREAMARVGRMRRGFDHLAAQREAVLGWLESGEPGLADVVRELDPGVERRLALATWAEAVLEKDGAEGAERWAESLSEASAAEKQFKLEAFHAVGEALATTDLEAARRFCASRCDGMPEERLAALAAAAEAAAALEEDIDTELLAKIEAIAAEPDLSARACNLAGLLRTLDASAIPTLRQALALPGRLPTFSALGAGEHELLVIWWAGHEPGEAARWSIARARSADQVHAVRHAVRAWARANPDEALAATGHLRGSDVATIAQIELVRGWYESGDPGVFDFVRELGPGFELQRALAAFAEAMVAVDGAETAARWAEALPEEAPTDEHYKLIALPAVGRALGIHDPEAGRRFCQKHCDGPLQGKHGLRLRASFASAWAERDGPAAMAWLETEPDNSETARAARRAYGAWGRTHRAEALAWMRARLAGVEGEPEGVLGIVYPDFVRLVAFDDGAEAIRLAEVIEAEGQRRGVLVDAAKVWRRMYEEEADAWLQQSPLSEDERQMARRIPKRRLRGEDFVD